VANSHRILLMADGRLGGELDAARTSESEVLERLNEKQGARPEVLQ